MSEADIMLGILLGLAAAVLYGGSDFTGGLASRKLGSVAVNLVGGVAATSGAWIALALSNGPGPDVRSVVWGLVGGIGGGGGSLALYRGLARGRMSVVGPVAGVAGATVPVVAGIAMGERPGTWAVLGVLVALPAIALVAANGAIGRGMVGGGMTDGLIAGAAFGLMFVALAQAGDHAGLWPVACEQTSGLAFVVATAWKSRAPLGLSVRTVGIPVLAGISGMAATLVYYYATHFGMLTTVAILTSLYPAVTVALARVVARERIGVVQRIGFGLSAIAVVAIAVG